MNARSQFAIRVVIAALIAVALFFALRPVLTLIAGSLMFVVSALFLPAAALVLGWFVYSVWGRVYFRAWRIKRFRNARDLREAVERGREA